MNKDASILIVEDGVDFSFLISNVLYLGGYANIRTVSCVDEAIKNLGWADLVVTDFNFPGGGYPELRVHLLDSGKPFIIQSSDPHYENHPLCRGFINKASLVNNLLPAVAGA